MACYDALIYATMPNMKSRVGRQPSPPLTCSPGSGNISSLPSIDECAPWESQALQTPDSMQPFGPEHYPDWFEWINVDGAYTMVEHAYTFAPMGPAPMPPPMRAESKKADWQEVPAHVKKLRAFRGVQHRKDRQALRDNPLCDTGMGRVILNLSRYAWYQMPNGLTAMQFGQGESIWRCNDCANNINWLQSGAYAHRTQKLNMLGVVNIGLLKPHFDAVGHPFFNIVPAPPGWPVLPPVITYKRFPRFLYDSFKSNHTLPPADPPEPKDAGQAARRGPQTQPHGRPSASDAPFPPDR